ncbi:peptide/nickel transport system ATP-binding protein [Aurantimonas endophytica]|uniref:Peptide/nickel transport system ATP-binding protein n=1 Tax=Aurantimonas endophytica TaxID=1522175 RepID=A0A7W6HBP5_9HYPH|nr:ABC transporter ATP-binding protein [Aurantimonas endophytica]MBB4002116.1 peptide/nickel transport system ATP-binding protein [Aurantimonas endophytica]MCO6402252.1 ATP-binding cassette domain-containing protein [Aurantimonas endophytica]
MNAPLFTVQGLNVEAATETGRHRIVDGVSFELRQGEILGLVGESGSGKTMACRALLRLLPSRDLSICGGSVRFDGQELTDLSDQAFAAIRGKRIAMIFQNPASHLDPVMRIGDQIAETVRFHEGGSRRNAHAKAVALLSQVGIPDPSERAHAYPHEFSGGMRQRAMIALALASDPDVLIADEPTTALDVTVQAQILRLLKDLRDRSGLSIIFITHDLGVVAQLCDTICVLYGGRVCELGPKREILALPRHPYTAGLLGCQPALGTGRGRLQTIAGQPPTVDQMPAGCRFHPRCANETAICSRIQPPLEAFASAHVAACYNPVGSSLPRVRESA